MAYYAGNAVAASSAELAVVDADAGTVKWTYVLNGPSQSGPYASLPLNETSACFDRSQMVIAGHFVYVAWIDLSQTNAAGGASIVGTNPAVLTITDDDTAVADADSDGMPDAWDLTHFGDLDQDGTDDYDSDGACDLLEYLAGTDPDNSGDFNAATDTDADGMPDIWEFGYFGDLAAAGTADADGDGLDNNEEDGYATDPLDADTDIDGFNDGIEVAAGTDLTSAASHPTGTTSSGSAGCTPAGPGGSAAWFLAVLLGLGIRRWSSRSAKM